MIFTKYLTAFIRLVLFSIVFIDWKNLNYICGNIYRIISSGRKNLTQGQLGRLTPPPTLHIESHTTLS